MSLNPAKDGVDHINIYSKSATKLGRMLSNFADLGFESPAGEGHFRSVEGYWYWLLAEGLDDRDRLRYLSGYAAKDYGRTLCEQHDWPNPRDETFKNKILAAIWTKIHTHDQLKDLMVWSSLPFEHYYVYNSTVIEPDGLDWLVTGIEQMRKKLKEDTCARSR